MRNVRPLPFYKQREQRQLLTLSVYYSKISDVPLSSEKAALRPQSPPSPPTPSTPSTTFAMAPKTGKVAKSAEALRLEALRKERATFPPELDAAGLRQWFYLFWSTETRAHPRTKVLSATASKRAPYGYPFFPLFFYCGLCPPFLEFFCDIMNTYGFHLLDFTPTPF